MTSVSLGRSPVACVVMEQREVKAFVKDEVFLPTKRSRMVFVNYRNDEAIPPPMAARFNLWMIPKSSPLKKCSIAIHVKVSLLSEVDLSVTVLNFFGHYLAFFSY